MTIFILGSIIALLAAALAIGPADRQSERLYRDLEREYADSRKIPWLLIRPVLRSTTSADAKLSAIGSLVGSTHLDVETYRLFAQGDRLLLRLDRLFRARYFGVVASALWLFLPLAFNTVWKDLFPLNLGPLTVEKGGAVILLCVLPLVALAVVLVEIGRVEAKLHSISNQIEESL